jgi:hypothetical protein
VEISGDCRQQKCRFRGLQATKVIRFGLGQSRNTEMPSSRVLTFSDPFPYQSAIRAADVELYPTSAGEFRAELTQINLNQLWMSRFDEKLPQLYFTRVKPGRKVISFLTKANQPPVHNSGMDISSRDIVVSRCDEIHHRTAGDCHFGTMSLTTDDFEAAHAAITGHEFSESSVKHFFRPSADLMARLVNLHGMVGQMAKTTPKSSSSCRAWRRRSLPPRSVIGLGHSPSPARYE